MEFLDYLKNEKLYTYDTIINYQIDIKQFQEYVDRLQVTTSTANKETVENFFLSLHSLGMSSSSLARKASTLRSYYSYLLKSSIIASTPMIGIKTPKLSKKLPSVLTSSYINNLLDNLPEFSEKDLRDKAILELMYSSGLRVSEVSNLNTNSINNNNSIRVIGKGSKERVLPITGRAFKCIKKYIEISRPKLENEKSNSYLFLGIRGGQLSDREIRRIVKLISIEFSISQPFIS